MFSRIWPASSTCIYCCFWPLLLTSRCFNFFFMFELADPICTILVSFTPWAVFMPKLAIIPLSAGISIIEKMTIINNLLCGHYLSTQTFGVLRFWCFIMFELADPVCTILVSSTPWTVFMSKLAIIPLFAETSIIEKMTILNTLVCGNCMEWDHFLF